MTAGTKRPRRPSSDPNRRIKRFKYVPFSEQVAKISMDHATTSLSMPAEPNGKETFFFEALNKWAELDSGNEFKNFLSEINHAGLSTYVQLLHQQENIADTLTQHLLIDQNPAMPALIEVLIGFARDLREDFFIYMWDFFDILIQLIEKNKNSIELLESCFFCLSVMVKLQWRELVKSLKKILMRLMPLFSSKNVNIRRFIAEVSSFLLRKAQNVGKISGFLVEHSHKSEDENVTDGIVQLFFNTIKGFHGQFQSRNVDLIKTFIEAILQIEEEEVRDHGIKLLEGFMRECSNYGGVEHCKPIVNLLLQHLEKEDKSTIDAYCRLLEVWLKACDGEKFLENERLLAICVKIMGSQLASQQFLQLCSLSILSHSNSALSTKYIKEIMDKSVERFGEELSEVPLIFNFYNRIIDLNFFDIHCLDAVGKLSEKIISQGHLNDTALHTILNFYFKHTLNRHPLQIYPTEDASSKNNLGVHKSVVLELQRILDAPKKYTSNFYPMALVIFPWFSRQNENVESTNELLDKLNKQIQEIEQSGESMVNIWLLTYHIALVGRSLFTETKTGGLISFLEKNSGSELALRSCLLIMKSSKESSMTRFVELLEILKPSIFHPSSNVRKLALQILKEHEGALDFAGKEETIFDVLLAVEEDPIKFENFRERAALLRRIRYGSLHQYLPKELSKELQKMTFGFILAQFYENLTVYWPMVAEIVGSYKENNYSDDFWHVISDFIEQANEGIREQKTSVPCLPEFEDESISAIFLTLRGEPDKRVDFWTFRLELFKLLSNEFVALAERRNRYLVQIFFEIYENEFQNVTANVRKLDDITSVTWFESIEDTVENADGNAEDADESDIPEESGQQVKKLNRKLVKNTLNSLMTIFAKFSNLKSAYKSIEIYDILNELLRTNDIQIQKTALACIFGFKNKALEPYRQNFINLVEEKAFRDELLHFSVDEENTVIKEDHRSQVIPVLLKLLDGKMNTHSGKNIPRKPAIFRFVAGCRPDELELFLKIVFWSINDLIDENSIRRTSDNITSKYDPSKTVALSRITNTLECLEEIYKRLAQSFNAKQNAYVYQITIACHLLIRLGLEHPKTSGHYRKILRSLRIRAFDLLSTLFNAFQRREFSADELNVFFELCVRPYLLPGNESDVPWAILRFFGKLTQIPYFYPLLNVTISSDQQTPLEFLFESLFSPISSPENKQFVVESCLNLLTYLDEQVGVTLPSLPQAILKCAEDGEKPFGTRVVVNFVPRLLVYLKTAISNDVKLGNHSATINFTLLEKISEFTDDPSLGNELASLLLPFVEAGYLRKDEHLAAILISIGNFLIHDKAPDAYFARVSPFFSTFRTRRSRNALVKLLRSLRSNKHLNSQLKEHIGRLEQLESWHPQRINEPDYEQRHEAMAELTQLYEDLESDMLLPALRAFIHSHFYSLATIDEISTRSASSNCLRLIVESLKNGPFFSEDPTATLALINDDLIPLIQRTTKSNSENIRHEVVNLLAVLVDNFGNEIEVLQPLCKLRNLEQPEVCFFENVTHLQIHRRQRAFVRLGAAIEEKEIEIPLKTLDKFITPLVRPYLLQTDSKYLPLSDEAIRLFAVIMRQQPWATYHRILTFYIDAVNNEEERNKPIIRVLVAVLGAFNFEVSDTKLPQGVNEKKLAQERAKKLAQAKKKSQKGKKVVKRRQFVSYSGIKPMDVNRLPNLNELNDAEKLKKLTPNQRILATVLRVILPRLRKTIRPPQEFHAHKKAQKGDNYFADEEEVNRAPIAIATVKFLQKLPTWAMDLHLQGIILTVLHLLLSRSYIVRESARKSVIEIAQTLGPLYLPVILNDLRQNLTRGYQVHVMIYTVHCLIACMQEVLKPGDLDDCFEDIFEVVKQQQFGQVEEERQIGAIKAKTPEAKSVKTAETFIMLGRFISNASLGKFIDPMKEIIDETPNAATFKKLQDLLRALSNGLRYNEGIATADLLEFSRSVLGRYIGEMCQQQDALRAQELQEKQEREAGYRPKHSLLLAAEPKRLGAVVKTSARSKVAVFVEFGLQLLGDLLAEKQHFNVEEDVKRLDPYFNLVLETLRLKYEKTTTLALRALGSLLKFPLPSIQEKMSTLVDRLFILLAEYANASGTTKLNVNELNQHLFKAVVSVLRQAPENLLTKHRLQILLNHVETDLLDPHKQATAFTLAKAIIGRKLRSEKVDELVKYLAELSVTSPIEQTRSQSRSTIHTFFRIHPDGSSKVERWLKFFLEQLDYEFLHGRLSALDSIRALFRMFNKDVVDKHGFSTFVRLASRFLEDDEVECHQFVCTAIRELIVSVSDSVRNDIYLATKDWLESEKKGPRYVGARAMVELVKIQEFKLNDERIKALLSTVINRFFKQTDELSDENEVEVSLNLLVELIRNHLDLMKSVLKKSPKLQKALIEGLPNLLTFSSTESVCYASACLLEHLLASTKSIWPLLSKSADLQELCNRSIQQLNFKSPSDQFVEEAVKNLVTLSVQVDEQTFDSLCEKLARLPKNEIRRESNTTKRLSLFKFMVAQLVHFNNEAAQFNSLIQRFGPVLFRELSGKSTRDGEKLLEVATEVATVLREKIGENEFNSLLGNYQVESARRQAERKRERNELLISNQQLAAKQKQHTNARKSSARKRKIDAIRPYRVLKRKRREEIQRTDEIE